MFTLTMKKSGPVILGGKLAAVMILISGLFI